MSSYDAQEAWNLDPVLYLNVSLSSSKETYGTNNTPSSPSSEDIPTPKSEDPPCIGEGELGNFDKLWDFLGRPRNLPPPVVPASPKGSPDLSTEDTGILSEALLSAKGVRWRDEDGETRLAEEVGDLVQNPSPQSSKARKKKFRAKWMKQRADSKACVQNKIGGVISSSENETEPIPRDATPIQSRRSIIQSLLYGTSADIFGDLPRRTASDSLESAKVTVTPHRYPLRSLFKSPEATTKPDRKPSEVSSNSIPASSDVTAEGMARRKEELIRKLHDRFVSERPYLGNLRLAPFAQGLDITPNTALHVFVDASNIMIGFHDSLKLSRGLSLKSRIRRQPISFHNLSIVLERGRPTTKRVLVGSDNFPSIQEAKLLGYETNILDRVHKAKELTPRQRKYRNVNGATSSGSETTAAIYAPEKWVEQAVDEILHLKILESVVDAETPATIVLATGDAAEAEYSQGFLKMVERALGKGWKVELCSFKKNISGAYRKNDFRAKWASQFKIIEMDDFVEELIGVE